MNNNPIRYQSEQIPGKVFGDARLEKRGPTCMKRYVKSSQWSRPPEREDKHTRKYKQLEIEEKESYKWLQAAQRSQRCACSSSHSDLHRRPGSRHLRIVGTHASTTCPCSIPHESRAATRIPAGSPNRRITPKTLPLPKSTTELQELMPFRCAETNASSE